MAGGVLPLRRASGSPPPLSGARQRLAQTIADRAAAADRLRVLEAAQTRARTAWAEADKSLAEARDRAAEAAARAHEHRVADLMGEPAPTIPTRQQAAAALQTAEAEADDLGRASGAIAAEIERLRIEQRQHADAIERAAAAVLAEEAQDATAKLVADIAELHAKLVDKGRALMWLWRQNVVRLQGDAAFPGAPDAREMLVFPLDQSGLWRIPDASPTETRFAAALDALKADASAEVPQ